MDANDTHDEATKPAPTSRDRLRALAADLLDTMETLDKPKTYLEVERAARAVMMADRMMAQLDQAPRTASRAASRASGRFADFDDDSYVSPYSGGHRHTDAWDDDDAGSADSAPATQDWAAIIEMKLDRLAKAKGYPPYGNNSYEAESGAACGSDDEDEDDEEDEVADEAETPATPETGPEIAPPPDPSSPPFSRERPLGPCLTSINYPEPARNGPGISTPPRYALSEGNYRLGWPPPKTR